MGLLNASNRERMLFNRQFNEALRLLGVPADIYLVDEISKNYDSDHQVTYKDPIQCDVLFEEKPSLKTLKALGWFTLEESVRPAIIYMPTFLENRETRELFRLDPQLHTKFDIHFSMAPGLDGTRSFIVTRIPQGNGVNNIYWTLGVSPLLYTTKSLEKSKQEIKSGKRILSIPKNYDL